MIGYSSTTIRQWASSFFVAVGGTDQEVDEDFVYEELASNRGSSCGNHSHIIHQERFHLKARDFVRSNATKKGEPNFTSQQFRDWIKAEFNVSVCVETVRVWLHHLGFAQHNHQRA